jgi:TPP-dependent indolepyruvate ferredoxin oxidoreductase alpha subunit
VRETKGKSIVKMFVIIVGCERDKRNINHKQCWDLLWDSKREEMNINDKLCWDLLWEFERDKWNIIRE